MAAPLFTFLTCHLASRPRLFSRAVWSLQTQTDKDFEHLVWVDPNPGAVQNMYLALPQLARAARGTYIHILDDDDLMTTDFIEEVKRRLGDSRPDYFFTHFERVYGPGASHRIPKQDISFPPNMGAVTHANINLRPELYLQYADEGNGYKDDKGNWVYAGDYWLIKRLWDGGLRPLDLGFVGSIGNMAGLGRSEVFMLPEAKGA